MGSVTVADANAGGAIDYAARIDTAAKKTAELEHLAGDVDRLRQAAEAVDAAAVWRRGRSAERVLVKQTFELPADASAEQRAATAEAIVADWAERGHPAIAAVHIHGKDKKGNDRPQPHMHVLATARPVDGLGRVDRGVRLWTDRAAVRDERARIAELINKTCDPAVTFHPGRLADTGIDREPQRRIPEPAWHERGQRKMNKKRVAKVRKKKAARREELRRRPPRPGTVLLLDPGEHAAIVRQISGVIEDPDGRLTIHADHPNAGAIAERVEVTGRARPRRAELAASAAAASNRAGTVEARNAELAALSDRQARLIADVFQDVGLEVPDLATEEGRAKAFARVRAARPRRGPTPLAPERTPEQRAAAEAQAKEATARRARLQAATRRERQESVAPAAGSAPYAALDPPGLRRAWAGAGKEIRIARGALERMPENHDDRPATAQRLEDARVARAAIEQEAERRGIALKTPRRRPGRRDDDRGL